MWLERMRASGVPAGAIRMVDDAMNAPALQELGLLSAIPHSTLGSIPNVGLPVHFSGTLLADPVAAPLLSAQTTDVIKRLLNFRPEQAR